MIDKIVLAGISPLGTTLVLSILALLLAGAGRRRGAVKAGGLAAGWLLLWSLPVVSIALSSYLENQFPPQPLERLPRAQAIVVLGGGVAGTGIDSHPADLGAASDRVWYGVRLFHAGKAPVVLFSGGSRPGVLTEAKAMAYLARDLGVPAEAIMLESSSRNTRQNARFSAELLVNMNMDTVLLVTSAAHMKRASTHFSDSGLTVVPAPTDYESAARSYPSPWLPDTAALDASAKALKEVIGQLVWRGGDREHDNL